MRTTALLLLSLFGYAAQAATISFTSANGIRAISSTHIVDIVVSDTRVITGGFQVSLNSLAHTSLGDLSATVSHLESGGELSLFRQIGFPATANGCSGDLNGTYTFADTGSGVLPCPATASPVASGTYRASGLNDTAILIGNAFNRAQANGTWRLFIRDAFMANLGSLGSWTVQFNVESSEVPEPGSWALVVLGLGATVALRRRVR